MTHRAVCTKDARSRRLGMASSAEAVDFEIHGLRHSTAENSQSETIDPADEDAAAAGVLRTHDELNVDLATPAAGVPLSSVTDSIVTHNKDAEGGGGDMGEFEFEGAMRSAVDDLVASARAAAMAVVPVKRRATDGRLDVDGQGLLNLVRTGERLHLIYDSRGRGWFTCFVFAYTAST